MKISLSLFNGSGFGLDGNQILHSNPGNSVLSSDAIRFIETTLQQAIPFESDAEILRYASDQVTIDGLFVELGTYKGRTANFLAGLNPRKTIYTFDSYEGFPAAWDRGDLLFPAHMPLWPEGEPLPPFLLNVELKKGWFADTLPLFVTIHDEPIAFLHVDCDIYESTAQALESLTPLLAHQTVILFDEFYNYPNFRHHEYKAFQEFLEKTRFEAKYLAYNVCHEQVAVRLIRSRSSSSEESGPKANS